VVEKRKNKNPTITRVTYCRVKNLGDYETCRVEAEAVVSLDESPTVVMTRLRSWVEEQLAVDA